MAKRSQHNAWNEVYALILLGVGTLLFLALISYVPKDIPTWFPLLNSTSSPNRPAQNFLGPLGAIVAGLCYFLIGAASYLLAVTLLGFGGAKLFHGDLKVSRGFCTTGIAFLISTARVVASGLFLAGVSSGFFSGKAPSSSFSAFT